MRFTVTHFRLFKEKFCECNLLHEENLTIWQLESYGLGWHLASAREWWAGKSTAYGEWKLDSVFSSSLCLFVWPLVTHSGHKMLFVKWLMGMLFKSTWVNACVEPTLIAQLYLTLWDPVDCSPPCSSVHGILQARILEWVAISSSRASFWPRDQSWVSCIAGRFFTVWATRETWVYVCLPHMLYKY